MIFKRYETKAMCLTLALAAALCASILLWLHGWFIYEWLAMPVVVYVAYQLYRMHTAAQQEIAKFAAAVRYRDFSLHYNEHEGNGELDALYAGFNAVNAAFKTLSKEKETQYQYLQNILELVDTGILSYDMEDGAVTWMNEPLKQLLRIPYLKNIQALENRHANLYRELEDLKPGRHMISAIHTEKNVCKILLSATAFQTGERKYKLVAFQNADEALDETEALAWHKLLRVMTHEIMNSVAPISSLADTLKNMLEESFQNRDTGPGAVEDMKICIDTIRNRSTGLLKFAETYRNLNKINSIERREVYVRDLFENICNLMQPTLEQKKIELEIVLKDPEIAIYMDMSLMEQALINLVLNAAEAVREKETPRIILSAFMNEAGKPVIKVTDNGHGIEEDLLEQIFIPFFSTRKNGSGIGLSLCRQIMVLHKGSIQVRSEEGVGTAFLLQF